MLDQETKATIEQADRLVQNQLYEMAKELYLDLGEKGIYEAYLKLGDMYNKQRLSKIAHKYYDKAYQIDPENPDLIEALKQRNFHDFNLESLINSKNGSENKHKANPNKYSLLSNNQLMKKNQFSKDLEACAHTVWLVARLLGLIVLAPSIIILFTSVKDKLQYFFYSIIVSVMMVISGWVAKTLMISFGVIVRNHEDEINNRNQ